MTILTFRDFAGREGSHFSVLDVAGNVELTLEGVEMVEGPPSIEQFSLFFSGPAAAQLEQRTYRLNEPSLGDVEIFLVPVALDGDRIELQACFNLMVPTE